MSGAPSPPLLLRAIAALASSGFVTNPMPEAPTGTNAASVDNGFPPVTMQSELAGGKPPLGQDMNGFLFLVSSHTLYVESGQTYKFDSTLAAQLGGYAAGTILGMTDNVGLWLCVLDGNSNDPDAGGAGWVPIAAYGARIVPVTSGTVTLTPAQTKYSTLIFTGILSGNVAIVLPETAQQWLIVNNTSGAFTLGVRTIAGGTSVNIPQGGFASPIGVYGIGDGNLYPTVAPLNLPIDQAPTASTIAQRTNLGYLLATYFSQNSPSNENPAIGAFFVENPAGDGFLRKAGLTYVESQMLLQGIAGQVVNGQVPYSVVQQWVSTFLANAALTGVPTAPTAASGGRSTQIATTAFANPAAGISSTLIYFQHPSGIVFQAGFVSNPSTVANVIAIPVVFTSPFTTSMIAGGIGTANRTTGGAQGAGGVSSLSKNGFTGTVDVNDAGNAHQGYWWAIGF